MDTPLTKGDKNFLGHFQNYILHHHSIKNLIQHDWLSISAKDFEDHWLCHYLTILAGFDPQPLASTAHNSL